MGPLKEALINIDLSSKTHECISTSEDVPALKHGSWVHEETCKQIVQELYERMSFIASKNCSNCKYMNEKYGNINCELCNEKYSHWEMK